MAPFAHTIIPVPASSSALDRTVSNVDLPAHAPFATVRNTPEGLRICTTPNLPPSSAAEPSPVFLAHSDRPNLIYKPHLNMIFVDHEGIKKGDVLQCRCTQNLWVREENQIMDCVWSNAVCTVFRDEELCKSVQPQGLGIEGIESEDEGEDGGVLISECIETGWEARKEIRGREEEDREHEELTKGKTLEEIGLEMNKRFKPILIESKDGRGPRKVVWKPKNAEEIAEWEKEHKVMEEDVARREALWETQKTGGVGVALT